MSELSEMSWHTHEGVDACARALGEAVAASVTAAIDARGRGLLALSGGNTPIPFLGHLRTHDLDWSALEVVLVDERWCPHTDARSNYGMICGILSEGASAAATVRPLWRPGVSLEEGARLASEVLADPMRLDVLVLGMGMDGHTASWIPDAEGLDAALEDRGDAVVPIWPSDGREARITLTRRIITGARARFLHITGAGKRDVLCRANTPGPWAALPIRAAFDGVPLQVYWSSEDAP